MPQSPATNSKHSIANVTCTACGCMCDDVELAVEENRIVGAANACPLGKEWFLREWPADRPVCLVDWQAAPWEEGCRRAVEILSTAKRPLVYGLAACTCEAQQLAVSIADWIGARIELVPDNRNFVQAFQKEGQVTATLGEVAQRADMVIFWGCDPATTHPRHFERYSLEPRGLFVPNGRQDRTCVVVDSEPTPTSAAANLFLKVSVESHAKALEVLHAFVAAADSDSDASGDEVQLQTGISLAEWRELFDRMKRAKYGVIFFDAALGEVGGTLELLLSLVRELNRLTRFVCLPLGERGNPCGAEQVLTWRTGYPAAVDLAKGFPEFDADSDATDADAALVIGLSGNSQTHLAKIPTVAIGHETPDWLRPTVAFQVATYGIHAAGTVFRCDGVPLPLQAVLKSELPSAETVLARIEALVRRG